MSPHRDDRATVQLVSRLTWLVTGVLPALCIVVACSGTEPRRPAASAAVPRSHAIAFAQANRIRVFARGRTALLVRDAAHPAWSPDGRRIAFERSFPKDGDPYSPDPWNWVDDLFVVNADGSGLLRVTDSPVTENEPVWSPDGKRIAFTSDRGGGPPDIWVMKVDGSGQHAITDDGLRDADPAWSPDGATIAFSSAGRLVLIDPDGTHRRLVGGRRPIRGHEPAWSSDGRSIAFVRDGGIWVVGVRGGQCNLVVPREPEAVPWEDRHRFEEPDWSPNGRWLVFEGIKPGSGWFEDSEVWLARADGTALGRVAVGAGSDPKWGPRARS